MYIIAPGVYLVPTEARNGHLKSGVEAGNGVWSSLQEQSVASTEPSHWTPGYLFLKLVIILSLLLTLDTFFSKRKIWGRNDHIFGVFFFPLFFPPPFSRRGWLLSDYSITYDGVTS